MSGVGKGIATASLGTMLQARGYRVNISKIDPYLNVDAGTMNPIEHGEVFVLDAGTETDQDMGNYERFLNRSLSPDSYVTNGMIYKHVLDKERALGYGGKTVEPIPHVTDEIIRRIRRAADTDDADVLLVEIGGTIGDYQNALFIEAARILQLRNPGDVMTILVSYLPVPGAIGEMKSKPTQNAVRQLSSYGLSTDMIVARAPVPLDAKRKEKIASATSVPAANIVSAPDIRSVYDVPLNFSKDRIDQKVVDILGLPARKPTDGLTRWAAFARKAREARRPVRIAIVGKYLQTGDFVLADAYLSVIEAAKFSAAALGLRPEIELVPAQALAKGGASLRRLAGFDGVIIPGGFGETGVEGKIRAIRYCRENGIPLLGLCYGMQLMVVEFARGVLGWKDAHTTEIAPATRHPVIAVMPEQGKRILKEEYGGTMRLGAYEARLAPGSVARAAYRRAAVSERHRHRYEVNNEFRARIEEAGLVFSGTSPDGALCEIAELPAAEHPFFLGTQFHPELKARPLDPHPLFTAFLQAARGTKRRR